MNWHPAPEDLQAEFGRQRDLWEKLESYPRFAAALKTPNRRPHLTFRCPDGHPMFKVTVNGGYRQASPWLALVGVADDDVLVDGWGDEEIRGEGALLQNRVRIRCAECAFERVFRHTELLERYASAIEKRKKSIRLSS